MVATTWRVIFIEWVLLIALFQFFADPIWIAPQIENREHLSFFTLLTVINTEWETTRKHAVKIEMLWMNSAEKTQTLDIG